ncbi:MAG: hypothetical protein KTR31_02880 [Myxococcales bacterium]|nr:hypothetical protein [Myxococcales bacterium]
MLAALIASLSIAHADTLLVARGSAELWNDGSIGSVYRNGALMGGAGVVVDLFGPISLDIDVAYRRMEAASGNEDQVFELIPVTFLAEFTFPTDDAPLDPYVGLGFAMVAFSERAAPQATGATVLRGTRPAVEVRGGVRFDLGLVPTSMIKSNPIKGVDLEVFGARRIQSPGGAGFDLASWRGGLGLAVRL